MINILYVYKKSFKYPKMYPGILVKFLQRIMNFEELPETWARGM